MLLQQETAIDGMAGLKTKFQNSNAKRLTKMLTSDGQIDRQTSHQSIRESCFVIWSKNNRYNRNIHI